MNFIQFKNILTQYLPYLFENSKDDKEKFIHDNAHWIINWLSTAMPAKNEYVQFEKMRNEMELFQTFSYQFQNRLRNILIDHLEKVLYGMVFGGNKIKIEPGTEIGAGIDPKNDVFPESDTK